MPPFDLRSHVGSSVSLLLWAHSPEHIAPRWLHKTARSIISKQDQVSPHFAVFSGHFSIGFAFVLLLYSFLLVYHRYLWSMVKD